MQSLVAIEALWIPFMWGGSFDIWDEAGDAKSWKIQTLSFLGRHGSQIAVRKLQGAALTRNVQNNLQREASALEVILHRGQTAHDGPDNLQEKWPTKIDFSENLQIRLESNGESRL